MSEEIQESTTNNPPPEPLALQSELSDLQLQIQQLQSQLDSTESELQLVTDAKDAQDLALKRNIEMESELSELIKNMENTTDITGIQNMVDKKKREVEESLRKVENDNMSMMMADTNADYKTKDSNTDKLDSNDIQNTDEFQLALSVIECINIISTCGTYDYTIADLNILEQTLEMLLPDLYIREEVLSPYLSKIFDIFPKINFSDWKTKERLISVVLEMKNVPNAVVLLARNVNMSNLTNPEVGFFTVEDWMLIAMQKVELLEYLDYSEFREEHFLLLSETTAEHGEIVYNEFVRGAEMRFTEKFRLMNVGTEGENIESDKSEDTNPTESEDTNPKESEEETDTDTDLKNLVKAMKTISQKTCDISVASLSEECLALLQQNATSGNTNMSSKSSVEDGVDDTVKGEVLLN